MTPDWLRRRIAIGSLIFFAAALVSPHAIGQCLYHPQLVNGQRALRSIEWMSGINVLASGWLGVFVLQFAWFANISLIIGALRIWRGNPSSALLTITVLLTASAFLPIVYSRGGFDVVPFRICADGQGPGFWFWVAANAMVAAGLVWLQFSRRRVEE